jgi:hypothetical protein
MLPRLAVTALATALVVAGCSGEPVTDRADDPDGTTSASATVDRTIDVPLERSTGGAGRSRSGVRLAPFDSCDAFLGHVRSEAMARVGSGSLDGYGYGFEVVAADMASAEASATAEEAAGGTGEAPGGTTGTNVQEAGIDEPDIVKTDGERIVTVSGNVLTVVDITSGTPVATGSLALTDAVGGQLFLVGDHAIVIGNGQVPFDVPLASSDAEASFVDTATASIDQSWNGTPAVTVLDVDLSVAGRPEVVATLRLEGWTISSRLVGERLLLALNTAPHLVGWAYPQSEGDIERALDANREMLAATVSEDWTPQYELTTADGTERGDLLACDQLNRPSDFAGFDVISVVDLDLSAGLPSGIDPSATVGVLAGGQTVYASADRFYVATTRWLPAELAADPAASSDVAVWSEQFETELHSFSYDADSPVAYVASGAVAGSLLNQFSMSEYDGHLRVLTTTGAAWDGSSQSETRLVVLAEDGDRLVTVGEVGGLGRGEALYSARMIGDRGFAVTFRQVDPFYVLDLSDPSAPAVTGELKIPGFSTYLHPVGDHRVLGIGKAATDDGAVTGFKMSLFDVSDPANPSEIATWTMDGADSPAGYDHHAFQMLGTTAIVPIREWNGTESSFNGAVVFEIGDTITEIGRISHVTPGDAPTSDCRGIGLDDVPADSELTWMVGGQGSRLQLCGPDAAGGYGEWYCEVIPFDQLTSWFGDPTAVIEVLDTLGRVEGGRLELCYQGDDGWSEAVQRSVVANGVLYTMSPSYLHANELATLDLLGTVGIS